MSTYEPGTVAVATVRGVPNVRVFRFRDVYGGVRWDVAEAIDDLVTWPDEHVTDVRPLVVLDLDDTQVVGEFGYKFNEPQRLVEMLRETADEFFVPDAAALARKVADQIEAQVKPPRIPEPGLWGVVEAETNFPTRRWVHHEEGRWISDSGAVLLWQDLRNPVLIRDGIEESS